MKAATASVPTTTATTGRVDVHPCSGASMTAYTSELIPVIDSSAPTGSRRVAWGSRESGTTWRAPSSATTRSGTLIQKTDDQPKLRISAPPRMGPTAMPSPLTAVQIAIARARSRGLPNTLTRIESVVGMMSAPPTPITARLATSSPVEPDSAAPTEPPRNVTIPATSAGRRPNRSPRLPAVSNKPANTTV